MHILSTNPTEKTERICLAMPHSLMVRMDQVCREMGVSRSHYMRTLIEGKNASGLYDKIDAVLDAFNRQKSA